MVSEDWVANLNKEFRDAGIDQRRRPWEAIRRYSEEFNTSVDISSDVAKTIFKWFEEHSKPGVHQVGSQYEAVYFYDSQFWVVSIPIMYGTVQLNALDCLHEMPDGIKQEMVADHRGAWQGYRSYPLVVNHSRMMFTIKHLRHPCSQALVLCSFLSF